MRCMEIESLVSGILSPAARERQRLVVFQAWLDEMMKGRAGVLSMFLLQLFTPVEVWKEGFPVTGRDELLDPASELKWLRTRNEAYHLSSSEFENSIRKRTLNQNGFRAHGRE